MKYSPTIFFAIFAIAIIVGANVFAQPTQSPPDGNPVITSSPWTEDAGNIHFTTGNVGIGVTSPATALDVSGDIQASGELILGGEGRSSWPRNFLVYHTMTNVPVSPVPGGIMDEMTRLWDGYSYAGSGGGSNIDGLTSDLGNTGSCLEEFRGMAVMECSGTSNCDHYTGGDYSYWLSATSADIGLTGWETSRDNYASRCSVFETDKSVLVRHSQTTSYPADVPGWTKLWQGYSYAQTVGGAPGYTEGIDLGSTGSCLPVYRNIPFLECDVNNCDHISPEDYAYWLSTYTVDIYPFSNDGTYTSKCAVYVR